MKTLHIEEKKALTAYTNADKSGRQLLSDLLGDQVNFSMDITERVKTFEDALEISGKPVGKVIPFPDPEDEFQVALNHQAMDWLIVEVLNEGWIADFSNGDKKWYVWRQYSSGSGLSLYDVSYSFTTTYVGARLCLPPELVEHVFETFKELYEKSLLFKK